MADSGPDPWAGLLIAFGVLLPLGLWFVHGRLSPRARRLLGVVAGLLLIAAAGLALSRTSLIGFLLGFGDEIDRDAGEEDMRTTFALLAALGLALGLAIALGLRTRDPEPAVADGGEDPLEALARTPQDTKSAYWTSDVVDAPPKAVPSVPVGAAPLALLVAALGLGLPVPRIGLDAPTVSWLVEVREVSFLGALALIVEGLTLGLALLLPALAVRGGDAWAVYAGYGLVAVGQGLLQAFPDTFSNRYWFVLGLGVAAGLLLPTVLRFAGGFATDDRAALAGGILVVVGLLLATTYLQAKSARDSLESSFSRGLGGPTVTVPAAP